MGNKSVNSRLDDLERVSSTDTWDLQILWTPEEVAEAEAAGHTIIDWGEPILPGEVNDDQDR